MKRKIVNILPVCLLLAACKETVKDVEIIPALSFFEENRDLASKEWILFIYAQRAWTYTRDNSIAAGVHINQYAAGLERGIMELTAGLYPDLQLQTIDDLLALTSDKLNPETHRRDLNDALKGMDPRVKYAVFSYGHILFILRPLNEQLGSAGIKRAAQATAFKPDEGDLKFLLGHAAYRIDKD